MSGSLSGVALRVNILDGGVYAWTDHAREAQGRKNAHVDGRERAYREVAGADLNGFVTFAQRTNFSTAALDALLSSANEPAHIM